MTVKMLRSSVAKELRQDYVYTAQSRGNSRTAILMRHVLRNALIPAITFLAVSMAEILTGSIIIEQVFTIPGIGRLLLASISNRDFPVLQAARSSSTLRASAAWRRWNGGTSTRPR